LYLLDFNFGMYKPWWVYYGDLKMLKKFSAGFGGNGKASAELLALGIHVVATKI
jgi:hypothetical protein